MVRYCSVSGCNNSDYNSKSNVFYNFPVIRKNHYDITHIRYWRWLDALKIDDFTTESKRKSFWLCQDHFISGKPADWRDINNPDWVPSKNLCYKAADVNDIDKESPCNTVSTSTQTDLTMYDISKHDKCCNDYVEQAQDKLQLWKKAISRPDRELGRKDQVCELHFLPEEISRHFVHKMPDGKIVVIKREVATLVNDAVPSIFPNSQPNLSINKRNGKPPVKRKPLSKKSKRVNTDNAQQEEISSLFVDKMPNGKIVVIERENTILPNLSNNKRNKQSPVTQQKEISSLFVDKMPNGKISVIEKGKPTLMTSTVHTMCLNLPSYLTNSKRNRLSSFERIPLPEKAERDNTDNMQPRDIIKTVPQFTFNVLLKNLSHVSKPHTLWAVSSHEDFIVCVKWDLNFDPERQVIIEADLGIKIKYHGTEVPIIPNTVIESVESLSLMLKEVDQYIVCPGAIKRNDNCSVYVKREYGSCGRPHNWCNVCVRKGNTSRPCFKIYRNCQWITSANQENARLKEKD